MAITADLLIVSGVSSIALTVWGRLVPPDSPWTKRGFVAVGVLGAACVVVAGFLNSSSQDRFIAAQDTLTGTINKMAENVAKLAGPASADPGLSPDQILAAAAAKLIQQDKEIARLKKDIDPIAHPTNGLYVGDSLVGLAQGESWQNKSEVVFQRVISGGSGLDFSQVFRYGNHELKCANPSVASQTGGMGVTDQMAYGQVRCEVVGR